MDLSGLCSLQGSTKHASNSVPSIRTRNSLLCWDGSGDILGSVEDPAASLVSAHRCQLNPPDSAREGCLQNQCPSSATLKGQKLNAPKAGCCQMSPRTLSFHWGWPSTSAETWDNSRSIWLALPLSLPCRPHTHPLPLTNHPSRSSCSDVLSRENQPPFKWKHLLHYPRL